MQAGAGQTGPQGESASGVPVTPVPLVVAVTGHRDLLESELPGIRERVRAFLLDLGHRYPDLPVVVMSGLAAGADSLVAEEAIALGLKVIAALPMPRNPYAEDFATGPERERFDGLCTRAQEVIELPFTPGNTADLAGEPGHNRDRQYAQLGVFLSAHCHVLLALWDGRESGEIGGTASVVNFHQNDLMPGYTSRAAANQRMLADDESDLVYHIVCSRDRPGGTPQDGLTPLETAWLTTDEYAPRTAGLPLRHRLIFERTSDFNRDALRHAGRIDAEKYPLCSDADADRLNPQLRRINAGFCVADWLAIHYQKRTLLALRITHVLAFFMGSMFILYSDLDTLDYFLYGLLGFVLLALGVLVAANRGAWHRKYLDYRALAEGLRVQFFWAAAGVTSGNVTKFAHDNFLQKQDVELGWIRNVMRVTGLRCDIAPSTDPEGIAFARREWIGDDGGGQLGYYRRKSVERLGRHRITSKLEIMSMAVGATSIALLLLFGAVMPDALRNALILALGIMLLLAGVRQAYAHRTAESELMKQYEFMYRVFRSARRRLEHAPEDADRRRILLLLGDAALDEHAEWIIMHRERPLDQTRIWRLGR
jgi:hypothetical protein